MACRVIKTIKGRQYLYEQRSYRVNGKVKTETRYLGAVDSFVGGSEAVSQAEIETLLNIETVLEKTPEKQARPEPIEQKQTTTTDKPALEDNTLYEPQGLTLQIKTNFKKHGISQVRAEKEYSAFTTFLEQRGIVPDLIPEISIGKASNVGLQKEPYEHYRVSLPRFKQKGARAEFWQTFNKAKAHQYLDALESNNPEYFADLKQNLHRYYQKQNTAIEQYIMRSKRKDVYKIGLTLHFMLTKMVSAWTQRHLDPTLIGLSDYSARSTWRDDTATLMAEVHNATWKNTYQKYADELNRAENIQFSVFMKAQKMGILDRLSGKRRATLKEWRKLDARRRAVYQACNKLSVLAPLYDGYPDSLQGSDLPFKHEENWKAKRMTWQDKLARFRARRKKK